jgi:hypothetical protein
MARRAEALFRYLLVGDRESACHLRVATALARLLFADFDRSVHGICAPPLALVRGSNGIARKHIPDFLLITDQGPTVVDVKPAARSMRAFLGATPRCPDRRPRSAN